MHVVVVLFLTRHRSKPASPDPRLKNGIYQVSERSRLTSNLTFSQVPGLPDSADDAPDRVRHSRYHLKGSDVYDIFEPVIKQIINLVVQQIKVSKKVGADVKGVIMVGGFGENIYLFERLQKALKSRRIEVRVSPQA